MVLDGVSSNSNGLFKFRLVRGGSSVVSSVLAEAVGSTDNDDDARGMILVRFVRAGWINGGACWLVLYVTMGQSHCPYTSTVDGVCRLLLTAYS